MPMFRVSILSKSIFPLIVFIVLSGSAVFAVPPMMRLEKGAEWVYEGKVEWTEGRTDIQSKQMQWITHVLDVFNYPGAQVAVVSGLPFDLDWYQKDKPPGYYLLVATRTNAYYLEVKDKEDAYREARKFRNNPGKQLESVNSFIDDAKPKCKNPRIVVKGFNSQRKTKCVETTERTNPDLTIIDFVYNLGMVHYYYEHFGTTSLVDVELKEVRFPQKK